MGQTIGSTGLPHDVDGGWTCRRREVIDDAAGVCARCGTAGADTAVRGWGAAELVAAHTRCVVGLGPPAPVRSYLQAA
jgi:hypothetical protein